MPIDPVLAALGLTPEGLAAADAAAAHEPGGPGTVPGAGPAAAADRGEGAGLPSDLPPEPFALFQKWFDGAAAAKLQPNPNAMALATVGEDGRPACRIVLCRSIDPRAGEVVWFTNRRSRKGRELAARPVAAATFHWDALDRQVRLEGPVAYTTDAQSDAYFNSRPVLSRIAAWVSDQSEPVGSRAELVAKLRPTVERLGIDLEALRDPAAAVVVPRPPHWGGYRLIADRVELWVGQRGRLHDRAAWRRTVREDVSKAGAFELGPWSATRLQP